MDWVETTGKTLDEAKDRALDELGVAEDDALFEVLSEARPGLFGRMRSEARVRARVRPMEPQSKEDRRARRRRPAPATDGGTDGGDEAVTADSSAGRFGGADGPGPGVADPMAGQPGEELELQAREVPDGPRRQGGTQRRPRREGARMSNDSEDSSSGTGGYGESVPLGRQAEVGQSFLVGVLERLGCEATVEVVEIDEDTVELAVRGDDLALLIGPKGSTVSALQDLTRTVVQRRTGARHGRLMVDVAGYRHKRRAALERFTREVAEQVLASGQERALEPMVSSDRKVVHDTVNTLEGLATRSEGEEPRRWVVIAPSS